MTEAATLELHEKFQRIEEECELLENPEPSHGIVLALLTQNHVVLLGPPGTGKSMISEEICNRIKGARFFHKLMARDLSPDEILVSDRVIRESVDEDGTKHIIFEKNPDGMLPESHIAFLDEIFKSNSTTLNKLLDIALERSYMMNGRRYKAVTQTIVGASNETPEDETRAFYDRIMLRYLVNNIREPSNFATLLTFEYSPNKTVVTLDELMEAQKSVLSVQTDDSIINKLIELRRELKEVGIEHSNRRWKQAFGIVRAEAWINGRDEVQEEDLEILQHCMWSTPGKEMKDVRDAVLQSVNPIKQQIISHFEMAQEERDAVYKHKDGTERAQRAVEANAKLKQMQDTMKNLIKQVKERGKPTAQYEEMLNKVTLMQAEIVTEHLGVDPTPFLKMAREAAAKR
jgi:MoxR-like ATPase